MWWLKGQFLDLDLKRLAHETVGVIRSQWLFEWESGIAGSQFTITSPLIAMTSASAVCILNVVFLLTTTMATLSVAESSGSDREECKLRPIIHHLKYPGCVPKSIPSFACQGQCSSYVQVRRRE
jgi:hypothetical protein